MKPDKGSGSLMSASIPSGLFDCHAAADDLILLPSQYSTLYRLVGEVNAKDAYTRRHSDDVMRYASALASAVSVGRTDIDQLIIAALLHDVGKICVPDDILQKPNPLTPEEFAIMKRHAEIGADLVDKAGGFTEDVILAIRHHHERWDGYGYPDGLVGLRSPWMARILAVADAYSAMTTDRPYRKGMERDKARQILEEGAERQWDPALIRAFVPLIAEFRDHNCETVV